MPHLPPTVDSIWEVLDILEAASGGLGRRDGYFTEVGLDSRTVNHDLLGLIYEFYKPSIIEAVIGHPMVLEDMLNSFSSIQIARQAGCVVCKAKCVLSATYDQRAGFRIAKTARQKRMATYRAR